VDKGLCPGRYEWWFCYFPPELLLYRLWQKNLCCSPISFLHSLGPSNTRTPCEIWDFHIGEDRIYGLLDCAMWCGS